MNGQNTLEKTYVDMLQLGNGDVSDETKSASARFLEAIIYSRAAGLSMTLLGKRLDVDQSRIKSRPRLKKKLNAAFC